jgi:hypothetical protein
MESLGLNPDAEQQDAVESFGDEWDRFNFLTFT